MARRKRDSGLTLILIGIGLWLYLGKRQAKAAPAVAPAADHKVNPSPVPAGMPQFPAGWEPDLPTQPAVASRAAELLFSLWGQGEGATVTEQTTDHWVTYQAQRHGAKKGVGVFRLKASAHGATG